MIKTILLILFIAIVSNLTAQNTWTFDLKNAKVGESVTGTPTQNTNPGKQQRPIEYRVTSGQYLHQAGTLYLYGSGLAVAGAGIIAFGSKNNSTETYIVGSAVALGGIICTIVGHSKILKAGIALDEERKISLHPASYGLGLALKF